ncbi:MAG: sigma 54-interacting transcriptional regulator [Thermodesulfobacteriota bacterium]
MKYLELLHSPILTPQTATLTQKASSTNVPVLIQGEQGTGRELIARLIHHLGDWKDYRFHKINCRVLTEETFRAQFSRLFKELRDGANPVTLYLREVGYLEPENQQRLSELVEEGFFQDGDEKKFFKKIRFISSSSEDLREKVSQGRFSEDLYYRLSPLLIHIPPLRERANEIGEIAQYVLTEHCEKMRIKKVGLSDTVLTLLQSYWWPGNLRELEHVIIRSAVFSEGDRLTEKDLFFEAGIEKNSFLSFLKKAETKPLPLEKKPFIPKQDSHFSSLFFMELVHRIKNPLVSIKTFTQLLKEKFDDQEFREYFYRIVTEDIEKIDSLLNGLLNYVKINTPLEKANTVHFILEDVLKKYEGKLEDKKIKVFKKFEKDLPETIVHEEQLRYILNSILQYALPSIPPQGSIGFLTKSLRLQKRIGEGQAPTEKDGRFVEIMVVFTGCKKPVEKFETILGVPAPQQGETIELELRLIKEMIHRNRGVMTFEVNEKRPRTLISLKFPMERRKVIYYPSTHAEPRG